MSIPRAPRALLLLVVSSLLGSCAAPAHEATPARDAQDAQHARPDGEDTAEGHAPTRRWSELDHDARMAVMGSEVMPATRRLFQGFDPERYATVSCATCHGQTYDYRMPNPNLYPLFPTGTPEQQAMVRDHPEMVRFMHNHVVPEIQAILGADHYDTESGTGFSCFSCHPRGG